MPTTPWKFKLSISYIVTYICLKSSLTSFNSKNKLSYKKKTDHLIFHTGNTFLQSVSSIKLFLLEWSMDWQHISSLYVPWKKLTKSIFLLLLNLSFLLLYLPEQHRRKFHTMTAKAWISLPCYVLSILCFFKAKKVLYSFIWNLSCNLSRIMIRLRELFSLKSIWLLWGSLILNKTTSERQLKSDKS